MILLTAIVFYRVCIQGLGHIQKFLARSPQSAANPVMRSIDANYRSVALNDSIAAGKKVEADDLP